MDLRVLVAVFITLFGIAVGMGQGQIDTSTFQEVLDSVRSAGDLGTLLEQRTTKEANITVQGSFTSPSPIDLRLTTPTTLHVTAEGGTELMFGGSTVTTRTTANLTMAAFTGTVTVDENVSITGTAARLDTPQFTFNASTTEPVSLQADTVDRVAMDDLEQQDLTFRNATGHITAAGGNNIQLAEDDILLTAFTGHLTLTPGTGTYALDGKIYKADIPTYPATIGGE